MVNSEYFFDAGCITTIIVPCVALFIVLFTIQQINLCHSCNLCHSWLKSCYPFSLSFLYEIHCICTDHSFSYFLFIRQEDALEGTNFFPDRKWILPRSIRHEMASERFLCTERSAGRRCAFIPEKICCCPYFHYRFWNWKDNKSYLLCSAGLFKCWHW